MRAHLLGHRTHKEAGAVMLMRTEMGGLARPERPSLLSRVYAMASSMTTAFEGFVEFRRQRRELLALDDRMLKDIGLSRADIMRIKPMRNPRQHRMMMDAHVKEERATLTGRPFFFVGGTFGDLTQRRCGDIPLRMVRLRRCPALQLCAPCASFVLPALSGVLI